MKGSKTVLSQVCSVDVLRATRPLHRVASEEFCRAAKLHTSSKRPSKVPSELQTSVEEELKKLASNLHSPTSSIISPMSVGSMSPQSRLTFDEWKVKKDFEYSLFKVAVDRVIERQEETKQTLAELQHDKLQKAQLHYIDWRRRKAKEHKLKNKQMKQKQLQEQREKAENETKAKQTYVNWLRKQFDAINDERRLKEQMKEAKLQRKIEHQRLVAERKEAVDRNFKDWVKSKSVKTSVVKQPKPAKKAVRATVIAYSPNKPFHRVRSKKTSFEELSSITQQDFIESQGSFYVQHGRDRIV